MDKDFKNVRLLTGLKCIQLTKEVIKNNAAFKWKRDLLGLGEDALKLNFKKHRSFLRQNDVLFLV